MSSTRSTPPGRTSAHKAPRTSPPPAQQSPASSSRRMVIAVVVAGLLALAAAVYLVTRSGDATPPGEASAVEERAATGIAHVHGLGVDPADGALYAGTHYGLFRVPEEGPTTPVADRVQDFMGFTVAGPNHYLASGHPGQGQEGPSSLGLIETTDGGLTWESLSLAGEADFHSLEARHGRVYGVNSMTGQFLVSEDKQTWEARSAIPMADFAVSPEDPDMILATTEQGVARSADGGRSFDLVPGAPVSLLVSWAEDGTIVVAEPDGTVHASTDAGATWENRGSLGSAPHALTATSDDEIYAAVDGAILASTNGGQTFTTRYQE